jgi:hypothetical protein
MLMCFFGLATRNFLFIERFHVKQVSYETYQRT